MVLTPLQIFIRNSAFQFEEFQAIPTNYAKGFEYFAIDGAHYLAVANYKDDGPSYDVESKIYVLGGDGQFQQVVLQRNSGIWCVSSRFV